MSALSSVATPRVRPWLWQGLLVSGIIGVLAAIAVPLYANV
jgi:hypothetical protein